MGSNLFNRLNGGSINLDGRDASLDTGGTGGDTYSLTITRAPASLEIGQAVTVTVSARFNGAPISGQVVAIASTNEVIGAVPDDVTTGGNGDFIFQIVAVSLGTAILSASMVIGGTTYNSNQVTFSVITQEAPENYDATGYGRVVLSVENPLAQAMIPRVQRLSNQEQIRKYPTDTGLHRVASYENLEVTFLPPFLQ